LEINTPNESGLLENPCQKILIFQQNGKGQSKREGILQYGRGCFEIETVSIDEALPPVLDETEGLLPQDIQADLVLDFLTHPDLSQDLARICVSKGIPIIASGKKIHFKGVHAPPT
jgi:hypothetical protein